MRVLPARRNRPGGFLAGRPVQTGARRSAGHCVPRSRAIRVGAVDLRSWPFVLRARQHESARRSSRQPPALAAADDPERLGGELGRRGRSQDSFRRVVSRHPGRPHRPFGERDQPRLPGSPHRTAGEGTRGVPICEAIAEAFGLRGLGQAPPEPVVHQGGRTQDRTADPDAARQQLACFHDRRVRRPRLRRVQLACLQSERRIEGQAAADTAWDQARRR